MTGPLLISGSANRPLAEAIAGALSTRLADCMLTRFPDSELGVHVGDARDRDVYLIQPTSAPVDDHVMELALMADACRRRGAARVTAVLSYFGYARQDRRTDGSGSVGARVVADILQSSGVVRVIAVDVHTPAIEGFFSVPFEHVSLVPLLIARARSLVSDRTVVVAPDLGAAKLAGRYARELNLPTAFVHKTRVSGTDVEVHGVTGEIEGRDPLIVDDMVSTGATIVAAANAVLAEGASSHIAVAATHGLLVGDAGEWLRDVGVDRLLMADTVLLPNGFPVSVEVVGAAEVIARAIDRMSNSQAPQRACPKT